MVRIGNCSSRKFPPDGWDTYWRHCGPYNDWVYNTNFCTPLFGNGRKDANYCNGIGNNGEWKLRTPVHQTSKNSFLYGTGNTVEAIQSVIDTSKTDYVVQGSNEYNNTIKGMLKGTRGKFVTTSDGRDMGPLYAPDPTGDGSIPLWDNWLANYAGDEFPKCTYNDWRLNGTQGSGCCTDGYTSCGIIDGMNVTCLRNSFAGSADEAGTIACCFNDLVCEDNASTADSLFAPPSEDGIATAYASNNKCFRSNRDDDMRTCKPESRSLGSKTCRDTITPYCTGEKLLPGVIKWESMWDTSASVNVNEGDNYGNNDDRSININGPCAQLLMRQLSGLDACGQTFDQYQINAGSIDLDGMLWGQEVVSKVFEKYIKEYGSPIIGINQDGIDAAAGVDSFLFSLCNKFPALCVNSLYSMCSTVTEETIAQNPIANKWCGCYMPEEQYSSYTEAGFLVSKQCTPFCSRDSVIPNVDANYQPLTCQENVCIINDVYLQFIKTSGNDINFTDVCNTCGRNSTVENANGFTTFTETKSMYQYTSDDRTSFGLNTDSKKAAEDGALAGFIADGVGGAAIGAAAGFIGSTILNNLQADNTTSTNIYRANSVANSYSNENNQQVSQTCSCKLDGITLLALNSELSNINFAANCGEAQCKDSSGNDIACSSSSFQTIPEPSNIIIKLNGNTKTSIFKKILIVGLVVLFLVVLFYIFFGNKKKVFIDSVGDIIRLNKGQTLNL